MNDLNTHHPVQIINDIRDGNYLRPVSVIMTALSFAFLVALMLSGSKLFPIPAGMAIAFGIYLLANARYYSAFPRLLSFRLLSTLIASGYVKGWHWLNGLSVEPSLVIKTILFTLAAVTLFIAALQTFLAVCLTLQAFHNRQKAKKEVNNA